MPTFIVKTREHVEGTYEVEADSLDAAREKFELHNPHIGGWDDVEQVDYMAFDVEVRSVDPYEEES